VAHEDANVLEGPESPSGAVDLPERIRRRYLPAREGSTVAFFTDATVTRPAFRDHGRRLSTDRNDPHVVRDLVRIAEHRGWTTIAVRGQTAFRREVWLTGRLAGLEVRGYRPSDRDAEDLARRLDRRGLPDRTPPHEISDAGARSRLQAVETVVRARVVDPAESDRLLSAARARLSGLLDRGAAFDPIQEASRRREPARSRAR